MIGIISDIHGNYTALKAVLVELEKLDVKKIICLGDVAGYYSEVNECCNILRKMNILTIMGNHDWYLSTNTDCPRSNSANDCLQYQKHVISKENLVWLKNLPIKATVDNIHIVHGGWNDPIDEYMKPSTEYFKDIPGDIFCSGHSHIQKIWSDGKKTYCNPGSVGQPRDGDPRAGFAVWDGNQFQLHRVPYDFRITQRKMDEVGFNSYYYKNLEYGLMIGK